jgi:hypothetical protein
MLIFCALDVSPQTVTNGTPQLDVLSLPEVNIMWGSFGTSGEGKNTGILPRCDVFPVMATKKNIPYIFLMQRLPWRFAEGSLQEMLSSN